MSNKANKIVFMGSTKFSEDVLRALHEVSNYDVVAVYTKPDAIRGRGNKLEETCVKQYAKNNNIPVETPLNFKNKEDVERLFKYKPTYICVVAYGLLLPKNVLEIPRYCLNIHPSELPKLRGAAPVERAILNGETSIPVSIMKMDEGLDTGDYVISTSRVSIKNKMLNQIYSDLAEIGSTELVGVLQNINEPSFKWIKQDENEKTEAQKIGKKELWFSLNDTDEIFMRKIQASSSSNPAKCCIAGKIVRILDAKLEEGNLQILRLRPDGKNEMNWDAFVAGVQDKSPENLAWKEIE